MGNRLTDILIGIDQLANTLIGGCPDETISARAWRLKGRSRFWSGLRYLLDKVSPGHCQESYESERVGRQLPSEYN